MWGRFFGCAIALEFKRPYSADIRLRLMMAVRGRPRSGQKPGCLGAVRRKQVMRSVLQVIALETVPEASPLETWSWQFPCAVALGSERFGLDPDVVKACDAVMRIPMFGHKNSLNVVMAFTLVAHAARCAFDARRHQV